MRNVRMTAGWCPGPDGRQRHGNRGAARPRCNRPTRIQPSPEKEGAMQRSAGVRGPRLTWLNSALVLIALGAAGCSADGNTSSERPGRTTPSPETSASASASASASTAKGTPSTSTSPTTGAAKPSKTPAPLQTRTSSVTSSRTGGASESGGGANDSGSIPQNPNTGPTPPPAPPRPSPTPEWSSAEWSPGDPVETVGAAPSLSAG